MSSETQARTLTLDSSSDTSDSRLEQELDMNPQDIEPSDGELTLRSVDERIKQATDPILRRVGE